MLYGWEGNREPQVVTAHHFAEWRFWRQGQWILIYNIYNGYSGFIYTTFAAVIDVIESAEDGRACKTFKIQRQTLFIQVLFNDHLWPPMLYSLLCLPSTNTSLGLLTPAKRDWMILWLTSSSHCKHYLQDRHTISDSIMLIKQACAAEIAERNAALWHVNKTKDTARPQGWRKQYQLFCNSRLARTIIQRILCVWRHRNVR